MVKNLVNFKYQYSWLLIPLFLTLYLRLPNYRTYLQYPMFCVGLIGIFIPIYVGLSPFLIGLNFIGHLPLFIGLQYGLKYFTIAPINIIYYLSGLLLIFYIPFWPYIASRKTWATIFTIISVIYLYLAICVKK